ncbi:hypothetical protein HU200_034656 [Digitaria exilis]|uniref:Uncharacterized protein n=1 Tax=Digitaria exilis TaxID=1010633 RepID=A0A835E1S2_9POAL|nr:hypothetical protein HU200_055386 [Digitaria exilis]KAF8699777.1 hypothetical protein HU200_034656 [Digitaria exilis]
MASVTAALLKMPALVAVCIALVLLSMGTPAMGDDQDYCRGVCRPACDEFATASCRSVAKRATALNETCEVRLASQCSNTCITLCTLDTLPDTPPTPCLHY